MKNECLIILGATNDDEGQLSPLAISRLDKAIEIIKSKPQLRRSSSVLLTGGFGDHFNRTTSPHAELLRGYLLKKGVENDAICRDLVLSSNTIEDAELSAKRPDCLNFDQINLLTSDFHLERALFLFHANLPKHTIVGIASKTPAHINRKPLIEHETRTLKWLQAHYVPAQSAADR